MKKGQPPRVKSVCRHLKFLAICKDPVTSSILVKNSPDNVIKGIANAAFNAQKGDVKLTPAQTKKLARFRKQIYDLADKNKTIKAKRKILVQKGGFAFLPLLLSTVLGTLGSAIINRISGN